MSANEKSVLGRRFRHRVGAVALGTATGQLITLAFAPLLTRLYTPTDFGQLGLYTSFVGLATVVACLRYDIVIASADDDEDAEGLTRASTRIAVLTAPLAAGVFVLLSSANILGFGALPMWVGALVAAGSATLGIAGALRYRLVRAERFRPIAVAAVGQHATRAATQVALALSLGGWLGLVLGELAGRGSALVIQARATSAMGGRAFTAARRVLSKYAHLPRYLLPSAMVDTLAMLLPLPLIAVVYGEEAAGLFFLVQRVLSLPIAFVAASVADVFFGETARLAREDPSRLRHALLGASKRLGALALVVAGAIAVLSPWAFPFVFGPQWTRAGTLAAIMAPWVAMQLTVNPTSRIVVVVQAQRTKLWLDVGMLVLVLGAIGISIQASLSLEGAIIALTIAHVLLYAAYFMLVLRATTRFQEART